MRNAKATQSPVQVTAAKVRATTVFFLYSNTLLQAILNARSNEPAWTNTRAASKRLNGQVLRHVKTKCSDTLACPEASPIATCNKVCTLGCPLTYTQTEYTEEEGAKGKEGCFQGYRGWDIQHLEGLKLSALIL
jgi:hypothetical protein